MGCEREKSGRGEKLPKPYYEETKKNGVERGSKGIAASLSAGGPYWKDSGESADGIETGFRLKFSAGLGTGQYDGEAGNPLWDGLPSRASQTINVKFGRYRALQRSLIRLNEYTILTQGQGRTKQTGQGRPVTGS